MGTPGQSQEFEAEEEFDVVNAEHIQGVEVDDEDYEEDIDDGETADEYEEVVRFTLTKSTNLFR